MSSVATLARLLWRPYLLWHLVPTLGLTVICWWLAFLARGGARGAVEPAQAVRNVELSLALGCVLFPMAFAAVIGWALYELLLCSLAPLLPTLRKKLFVALLTCGLVCAALTAWWCTENPGAQFAPPFFALAFLSYALAILWSDPEFARWGHVRWLLQVVALAPIFYAPELVQAFTRAPFVLTPLGLLAGAGILGLPFRSAAMRERALDPACAPVLQRGGAVQRVSWNPGRTLSGCADWTRAALHEGFGHARGGWVGALFGNALLYSAILVAVGLVLAALETRDDGPAASSLYAFLAGAPRRGGRGTVLLSWALPIWASFALLAPVRLGGAGFCPLSRARRAEVAGRANLLLAAGVVLTFAVVLGVVSEVAFAFSGRSERVQDVPEFVHVLASTLIAAPLVFEARLRWLDDKKPLRAHDSALLGLLALVLALPAVALSSLWRAGLRRWDELGWLALVLCLYSASLILWQASVTRHFARQDLST